jgi:aspartyl-tRNA(Asn)/glutamyl-tRNA(Gln) amidotransferase subunit A
MTGTISGSVQTGDEGLIGLDISQCRAAIVRGDFTAVEATAATLDALSQAGAHLNAVARLEPEAAHAQAHEADAARLTGVASDAPLLGVPLAHKDLYGRKGWALEAGSAILRGNVATQTAFACTALDHAGALDLGRLNTVEFALGGEGLNAHTGPVKNPWNPDHVTGGSSSGSAAAVASGAIAGALGSDTGGSIRMPAAACGLVGLKPTAGLVSRAGVFALSGSLDTVGPMTRTVTDAALMLSVIAGHDPSDPQSIARPPVDYMSTLEDGLRGLRIGVPRHYFNDTLAPEVALRMDDTLTLLESEGAVLIPVDIPGIDIANRLNMLIIGVEAAAQHAVLLATRAGDYGPVTRMRMIAGLFQPAGAYLRALERRASLLAETLAGALSQVDIMFAPTWPIEVPRIDLAEASVLPGGTGAEDLGHSVRPVNFLGLPAIALPAGLTANGLPTGFQLIGRPFSEALLLRAARAHERAFAFWQSHCPVIWFS